jgi:hypothetical protein
MVGATANLDGPSARRQVCNMGGGEGTGFEPNKGAGYLINNIMPLTLVAPFIQHVDQETHL